MEVTLNFSVHHKQKTCIRILDVVIFLFVTVPGDRSVPASPISKSV
jgi:hypothetical protein